MQLHFTATKKTQQNNGSMEILAIDQIKFTKVKKTNSSVN